MVEKKIFLVAGQAITLSALKAKFRLFDFRVESANISDEVEVWLEKIKFFRPVAVILDLNPKEKQWKCLGKLKIEESLDSILVFIWSDLSEEDLKEKCESLGADYCFSPLDLTVDEFVVKVGKILEKKRNK
jgi:DNA-binding NtrC family response regulator